MTGTVLLDAAIGVVFVVLSFSLVASALNEALATVLNWRGRMLRRGLFRLLEGAADSGLVDRAFPGRARLARAALTRDVLADPAIRVLHGPRGLPARIWDWVTGWRLSEEERAAVRAGRLPSAIPPESFARALVETLVRRVDLSGVGVDLPDDLAGLRAMAEDLAQEADRVLRAGDGVLATLPLSPAVRQRLREGVGRLSVAREVRARLDRMKTVQAEFEAEIAGVIRTAETRLHGLLVELADWFEKSMERVSGWYVRRSRLALFLLGLCLAAAMNVDLARMAPAIVGDPELRGALVDRAEDRLATPLPAARPGREGEAVDLESEIDAAHGTLSALPVAGRAGFGRACGADEGTVACLWRTFRSSALISWILIGLGCMMGGQFWYDFLGAVMRFRPALRRLA